MSAPLDYEPPPPRETRKAFWVAFFIAGSMTTFVLSSALSHEHIVDVKFNCLFLIGMAVTGMSVTCARWTDSIVGAIGAGIFGPPAIAILITKLVAVLF